MPDRPVPKMTDDVWDIIKDLNLTNEGWEIGLEYQGLHLERDDVLEGKSSWIMWAFDPKGSSPFAAMDYAEWAKIKGGTLNTSTNTITEDSTTYRVTFGRGAAMVEEVD